MKCRHCKKNLKKVFIDLGHHPLSNAYLSREQLAQAENTYPLKVFVCEGCFLVQTMDFFKADEIFNSEYAYYSSHSETWLKHAAKFCKYAIQRFSLCSESLVVEVASNDGYLLRNFLDAKIPCFGIEPAGGTADKAQEIGIETFKEFFSLSLAKQLAKKKGSADLIIANNVYAHVPDINDFTKGLTHLLSPEGVVSIEFPHLLNLVEKYQFDTIYHEHFSYLSLYTVNKIFMKFGLRIFDVQEVSTHGGSLRVLGCKRNASHEDMPSVEEVLKKELSKGINQNKYYTTLAISAERIRLDLIRFLIEAKDDGKKVCAYGAAAKGNTLLNFAGIKNNLIEFVCDKAESKIGKFLPGSHIPVFPPDILNNIEPDYLIILPWNIYSEVSAEYTHLKERGCKFIRFIPEFEII